MKQASEVVKLILQRFKSNGYSQVPGYKKFGFIGITAKVVTVSREAGEDTRIPFTKLEATVQAARKDPLVYDAGPGRLREHGITHINSPLWSLLHMVSKQEIAE